MRITVELAVAADGEALPVAVHFGKRRLAVNAVLDRWHGRRHTWWKLDTPDGPCILRHDERTRQWSLAAVPNAGRAAAPAAGRPARGNGWH